MKKNMMRKNLRQSIKKSMGRYIAIAAIIALGAGLFCGLRVTKKDMVATVQDYTDKQNMFDLRVMNSYGWTDEEVSALLDTPGIADAEGSCSLDALVHTEGSDDHAFKLISLTENVNKISLDAGRMPTGADECLLDSFSFDESMIGTRFYISDANEEDTLDSLACRSYTVVGLASTPLYLNMQRGSTSIGSGSLSGYLYLMPQGFDLDVFTEINLTMEGEYAVYSDAYNDAMDAMAEALEPTVQALADGRYNEIRGEAEEEYNDGYQEYLDGVKEYRDGKREAEQELEDARIELTDGEAELEENRQLMTDGQKEINSAWGTIKSNAATLQASQTELTNKKTETYAQLDAAKQELDANQQTVRDSLPQVEAALAQIDAGLSQINSAMPQLTNGIGQIDSALAQIQPSMEQLDAGIADIQSQLAAAQEAADAETAALLEAQLAELNTQHQALSAQREALLGERTPLQTQLEQLQAQQTELTGQRSQVQAQKDQLDAAQTQIDGGYRELEANRQAADAQFADAQAQLTQAQAQLDSARKELNRRQAELNDGQAELAEAEQSLADGWQEYEDGKAELEAELLDAGADLEDARVELEDAWQEIEDLEAAESYVLTRNTNVGYVVFESDSDIVDGVAKIFPAFFLAVAALVCITTMTRMVDEERTQIGTLKALGYGNFSIIGKYLAYSGSSAILGCTAGVLIGCVVFPQIIWYAYCIMYNFSDRLTLTYDLPTIAFIVLSYTGLTLLVTWYCCRQSLKDVPAELIRPKAPAAGKQVFLEKLPVWKHLSFLNKVAIRNIFRYRQRMAMMLLGIGGCTALLVTGFGVSDSVVGITDYQYQSVMVYDIGVSFGDPQTEEQQEAFRQEFRDQTDQILFCQQSGIDLEYGSAVKSVNFLAVEDSLDGIIDLHDGRRELPAPGLDEALISVGAATAMGIDTGDTVTIRNSDMEEMELTVSGIFDNNVYNYVIVSGQTMENQWGRSPEMNSAFVVNNQQQDVHELGADLAKSDGVLSVTISQDTADQVNSMMDALGAVVALVVVCAGLLAAIVLYNLTNINIKERVREIATIKVLGFHAGETGAYVFKENLALTVMGTVLGLFGGKLLHTAVMSYVRIDMVWFENRISWLSYLIAAVLTVLCALIVDFIMYFQLDKINMAEALKSVE